VLRSGFLAVAVLFATACGGNTIAAADNSAVIGNGSADAGSSSQSRGSSSGGSSSGGSSASSGHSAGGPNMGMDRPTATNSAMNAGTDGGGEDAAGSASSGTPSTGDAAATTTTSDGAPAGCTSKGAAGGGGGGGVASCVAFAQETCSGVNYSVTCSCPQGECACIGPATSVITLASCPVCPSPSEMFTRCGFPQ